MKTKVLLLGAAVAAFTITTFAAEPVLTPRAAGNQIKAVTGIAATPATAPAAAVLLSPRAAGNQIAVAKGGNDNLNPALGCPTKMAGSPKAVAECGAHTTMPGCATVAMEK